MSQVVTFQEKPATALGRLFKAVFSKRTLAFVAVGLALVLGPLYWFALAPPSSVQAFVNTDIVVMRAPVAGRLSLPGDLRVGRMVGGGQEIGRILSDVENPQVVGLKIQHEQARIRVAVLEAQISGLQHRLEDRTRLVAQFGKESEEEQRLRQVFLAAGLKSAREELRRLQARATVANASERRTRSLSARGVVSQASLEGIVGTGEAAEAEVDAHRARVLQIEAALEAAAYGIDLDTTRGIGQPTMRLRELRSAVVDLEQQEAELRRTLEAEKAGLAVIDAELDRHSEVALTAPHAAVVWSIDARSGETVAGGTPLLQLADCRHIWIEAFFDESDAAAMTIGRKVKVRLLHGGEVRDGVVETVRAGSGRVNVGEGVVLPPPEIARRQLPVRVVTVRVRVDWAEGDLRPEQFCLAGRSAEVFVE